MKYYFVKERYAYGDNGRKVVSVEDTDIYPRETIKGAAWDRNQFSNTFRGITITKADKTHPLVQAFIREEIEDKKNQIKWLRDEIKWLRDE